MFQLAVHQLQMCPSEAMPTTDSFWTFGPWGETPHPRHATPHLAMSPLWCRQVLLSGIQSRQSAFACHWCSVRCLRSERPEHLPHFWKRNGTSKSRYSRRLDSALLYTKGGGLSGWNNDEGRFQMELHTQDWLQYCCSCFHPYDWFVCAMALVVGPKKQLLPNGEGVHFACCLSPWCLHMRSHPGDKIPWRCALCGTLFCKSSLSTFHPLSVLI